MTIRLAPYPAYKDSGVDWLGEIPADWDMRRAKYLLNETNARSDEGREQLLSVSQYTGVTPRPSKDGENEPDTRAESLVGYKLVDADDLAVNIMLAWNGSLGVSPVPGLVSPAYCVYRFSKLVNAWYYHYLLRSPLYKSRIKVSSTGVVESRLRLYSDDLFRIEMLVPPEEVQNQIVRFLYHQDRQITRLIRAKRRLIDLLTEQKQAIIQQAVTRGLDPTVRLMDSGVAWLGEVPEHWDVVPLKALSDVQSGLTLGKDYGRQPLHEYPYLRVANVQAGRLDLSEIKLISIPSSEASRYMLQTGDVLMTEGGDPDKLGRGTVWESEIDPCLHQNHIFAVRPNPRLLNPYFLSLLLGSQYAKIYFTRMAKQTTNLASTNKTTIGLLPVVLPGLDEQTQILTSLKIQLEKNNCAITSAHHEIDLLREYRTRLIADVVTGKLDVRGVELPAADVDEPTPLYEADLDEDGAMDEEEMLAAAEEEAVYATD